MTFRFIGILGDFKDHGGFGENADEPKKQDYIKKCRNAIEWVHERHMGKMILVTSDSNRFLNEVKDLEYVFFAPGEVVHMDFTKAKSELSEIKSFADMLLIAHAQLSYVFATGKMFSASIFARTSAATGGHDCIMLKDSDICKS